MLRVGGASFCRDDTIDEILVLVDNCYIIPKKIVFVIVFARYAYLLCPLRNEYLGASAKKHYQPLLIIPKEAHMAR